MMEFKNWMEEFGLADYGMTDPGTPKIKNKKVVNKYKIPDIPTFSFERDRGMATKSVESKSPLGELGTVQRRDKSLGIPKYKFDVTQASGTKLDPG